jgi:hypothetical protein
VGSIRGTQAFDALRPQSREAYERALEAISLARRENYTIKAAAQQVGVSVATIKKYAGDSLRRDVFGRLRATESDRLVRLMHVSSDEGDVVRPVRGSGVASDVATHANDVRYYLATGDASRLARWRGVRRAGVTFASDPDVVDRLAREGQLDWLSIY